MDISPWTILLYMAIPAVLGLGKYIWGSEKSNMATRLDKIELKLENSITEKEVRQIINDKLDHIQNDLKDIKTDLRNLYQLYVDNKTPGNR